MENVNFSFKFIPSNCIKNLLEILVKLKIKNAELSGHYTLCRINIFILTYFSMSFSLCIACMLCILLFFDIYGLPYLALR